MGSEHATISVDLITRDCWYSGSLANRGFRLADVLNERTSDTLTMHDTVSGVVGTSSANVHWKEVLLRKNGILMAIPKGSYEAPLRRQNNFVERNRYGAMIVLPGHVISGIVYLPPRGSAMMLLDENSTMSGFIAVTDVTVHSSIHSFPAPRLGVAIVQRKFIESLQLTPQSLPRHEEEEKVPEALSLP